MEVCVVTAITSGYGYYRRTGDLEQSVPATERRIPVTELLRREGCPLEPTVPPTRRALGGVAAGAVLAFGAVVGGLMAQHANTPANATGNMADQPVPYQGAGVGGQPQGGGQSPVGAPLGSGTSAAPGSSLSTAAVMSVAQVTSTATNQPAGGSTGAGRGGSGAASTSAPSTTSNTPPPSSSAPTTPPSQQSGGTTTPKPPPSSSSGSTSTPPPSSGGGGLLGTVGGVLDGLLHPVTGLLGGL